MFPGPQLSKFFVFTIISESDAEDLVVFLPGHESTVHLDTSTTVFGSERIAEEDDRVGTGVYFLSRAFDISTGTRSPSPWAYVSCPDIFTLAARSWFRMVCNILGILAALGC